MILDDGNIMIHFLLAHLDAFSIFPSFSHFLVLVNKTVTVVTVPSNLESPQISASPPFTTHHTRMIHSLSTIFPGETSHVPWWKHVKSTNWCPRSDIFDELQTHQSMVPPIEV